MKSEKKFKKLLILIFIQLSIINYGYTNDNKEYEATQGKEVTDFIAPYLKNFCKRENIDFDALIKKLFEDYLRSDQFKSFMPFFLSSEKYINGNWTYFTAKTPLIYEIEKVESEKFLILYSKLHPELILTNKESEWQMALIDVNLKIIDNESFFTQWKYNNEYVAMWDMIYTRLDVKDKKVIAKITYVHTGSGGGRDQEYTITTNVTNKIDKIIIKQTLDLY